MKTNAVDLTLLQAIKEKISTAIRYPLTIADAAAQIGSTMQELLAALKSARRAKTLDREIDRRVRLQSVLDEEYVRNTHLVSAPLLTADEIRRGELIPSGTKDRPFVTLALPKELAGGNARYCSFIVPDDCMAHRKIFRGDLVICIIGFPPRTHAPVLCVLPKTKEVCVRSFFNTDSPFYEIGTPKRTETLFLPRKNISDVVIGPIIGVQRYMLTWRGVSVKSPQDIAEEKYWHQVGEKIRLDTARHRAEELTQKYLKVKAKIETACQIIKTNRDQHETLKAAARMKRLSKTLPELKEKSKQAVREAEKMQRRYDREFPKDES